MTDPRDLLDAARTDPTVRGVLADRVREEDGDTPAVSAVAGMCCEVCGCPESGGKLMCRDRYGAWRDWWESHGLNSDEGFRLFDMDDEAAGSWNKPVAGRLALRRRDRWHLVCVPCSRSLAAREANATRKANRQAREDAAPNLFSGVDDDGA